IVRLGWRWRLVRRRLVVRWWRLFRRRRIVRRRRRIGELVKMTMAPSLTPEQHQALAQRIRTAESKTRGEIYCVVAHTSDSYFFPAAFMLTAGMLVASLLVAFWVDRSWFDVSHLTFVIAQVAA